MQVANRFNAENNHVSMGFHPRVLQDSEMNELVSIIQHQQKKINSLLYPDGTLIKGFIEAVDDGFAGSVGSVMCDGYQLYVDAKTVIAPKNCIAGLKISKKILTANEDDSLRDGNKDSINFGMPGADRLAYSVHWAHDGEVDNESIFVSTHQIIDGKVKANKPRHTLSFLASLSYDAVVGAEYSTITEALEAVGENAKILVTQSSELSEPIKINKSVQVDFAGDVSYSFADDFEHESLFEVSKDAQVNINGGSFVFPNPSKKLCIAGSRNVFVSKVYLKGDPPNVPDSVVNCEIFGIKG